MGMLLRRHQNLEVRPSHNDENKGVTEQVAPVSVEEEKIDDAKQRGRKRKSE